MDMEVKNIPHLFYMITVTIWNQKIRVFPTSHTADHTEPFNNSESAALDLMFKPIVLLESLIEFAVISVQSVNYTS